MTAPWKPVTCACGAPHPSWSMSGNHGPWRCHPCHRLAASAEATAAHTPTNPAPPAPTEPQGSLL